MDKRLSALMASRRSRLVIFGLGGLFLALIIFQIGIYTGYHKASLAFGTGAAYYNVFEGKGNGGPHPRGEYVEAHGAAGKILSISLPTFIVQGPDNFEKIILIDEDTDIRSSRDEANSSDLAAGDFVVVIGEPNGNAQVVAKLIRILPPPPDQH
jgi:hypothetical protein